MPIEALGTATEAFLLGDFNSWDISNAIALVEKNGVLTAAVELEPGKTYEYKYYLNNGSWVNSWNAEAYAFNALLNVENSVVSVPVEVTTIIVEKTPAKKAAAPKKTAAKKAAEVKPVVAAAKKEVPAKNTAAKKSPAKKAAAKTAKK